MCWPTKCSLPLWGFFDSIRGTPDLGLVLFLWAYGRRDATEGVVLAQLKRPIHNGLPVTVLKCLACDNGLSRVAADSRFASEWHGVPTMTCLVDVMRSWMKRREWNSFVRLMISLSFSPSVVHFFAASTSKVGEGRPFPTTIRLKTSSPHVARTLSSIDLVWSMISVYECFVWCCLAWYHI